MPLQKIKKIARKKRRSGSKKISYRMIKLGRILESLRKERNMSLRQAAKLAGLTPSHLSKLEAGHFFKSITIDTLLCLSNVYKIPVHDLLTGAGLLEDHNELPRFDAYLRSKYHFTYQAIRDMEIAKEIISKKYRI